MSADVREIYENNLYFTFNQKIKISGEIGSGKNVIDFGRKVEESLKRKSPLQPNSIILGAQNNTAGTVVTYENSFEIYHQNFNQNDYKKSFFETFEFKNHPNFKLLKEDELVILKNYYNDLIDFCFEELSGFSNHNILACLSVLEDTFKSFNNWIKGVKLFLRTVYSYLNNAEDTGASGDSLEDNADTSINSFITNQFTNSNPFIPDPEIYKFENLKLPPLKIFHKENHHFTHMIKKIFINLNNPISKTIIINSVSTGLLRRKFIIQISKILFNYVFIDYKDDKDHCLKRFFSLASSRRVVLCVRWKNLSEKYRKLLVADGNVDNFIAALGEKYLPNAYKSFLSKIIDNTRVVILTEANNESSCNAPMTLQNRYFTLQWTWGNSENIKEIIKEITYPILIETENLLPTYVDGAALCSSENSENSEILETTFNLKCIYNYLNITSNDFYKNITSIFKITCRLFTRRINSAKFIEIQYKLCQLSKKLKSDFKICQEKVNDSEKVLKNYENDFDRKIEHLKEVEEKIFNFNEQILVIDKDIEKCQKNVDSYKSRIDKIHEFYKNILDQAQDALPEAAIDELKKYRDPPKLIKTLVGFLCDLLKLDNNTWVFAREKLLSRADLHKDLSKINRDKINNNLLKKLELFCTDGYIAAEIESYQVMYKNSKAAALVYIWLQGIVAFCDVRRRTKQLRKFIKNLKIKIDKKNKIKNGILKKILNLEPIVEETKKEIEALKELIKNHKIDVSIAKINFNKKNNRLKITLKALKNLQDLYPDRRMTSKEILKKSVKDVDNIFHKKIITKLDEDNLCIIRHLEECLKIPIVLVDSYGSVGNSLKFGEIENDSINDLIFLKETDCLPEKSGIYVTESQLIVSNGHDNCHIIHLTTPNHLQVYKEIENTESSVKDSYYKQLQVSQHEINNAMNEMLNCLSQLTELQNDDHDEDNESTTKTNELDNFLNFDSEELIEVVKNTINRKKYLEKLPFEKWADEDGFLEKVLGDGYQLSEETSNSDSSSRLEISNSGFTIDRSRFTSGEYAASSKVNKLAFLKIAKNLIETTSISNLEYEQSLRSKHFQYLLKEIFQEQTNFQASKFSSKTITNVEKLFPIVLVDQNVDQNLEQNNLKNVPEINYYSSQFRSNLVCCVRDGKKILVKNCINLEGLMEILRIYEGSKDSSRNSSKISGQNGFIAYIKLPNEIAMPNVSFLVDFRSSTIDPIFRSSTDDSDGDNLYTKTSKLQQAENIYFQSQKSRLLDQAISAYSNSLYGNNVTNVKMDDFAVLYHKKGKCQEENLKVVVLGEKESTSTNTFQLSESTDLKLKTFEQSENNPKSQFYESRKSVMKNFTPASKFLNFTLSRIAIYYKNYNSRASSAVSGKSVESIASSLCSHGSRRNVRRIDFR